VYFPRRVIPMLPEKLSNGLCSLNPQVDRCVLACDMVITARARSRLPVLSGRDHSAARLTYTEVAAVLSNTKGRKRAARICCRTCRTCTAYRRCSPQKRGAIDFDTTETYIVCNAQGKIEQIVPRSATTRTA
jgi:ribonuclease R